jgi:hypothetical protein
LEELVKMWLQSAWVEMQRIHEGHDEDALAAEMFCAAFVHVVLGDGAAVHAFKSLAIREGLESGLRVEGKSSAIERFKITPQPFYRRGAEVLERAAEGSLAMGF